MERPRPAMPAERQSNGRHRQSFVNNTGAVEEVPVPYGPCCEVTRSKNTDVAEPSGNATQGSEMNDLQKAGGVAGLIAAATYVLGFALYFTLLDASGYGSRSEPLKSVVFLAEHQTLMYAWNLTIYVVNAVALVVLTLALHERLTAGSPALSQVATAFGLIWSGLLLASGMIANIGMDAIVGLHDKDPAQAATLWLAMSSVEEGLGGGNELAGGLWILLASVAALRTQALSAPLSYLGIAIGAAGLLTVIPSLELLGAIFGLGFIVWFAWVGIVLLRRSPLHPR